MRSALRLKRAVVLGAVVALLTVGAVGVSSASANSLEIVSSEGNEVIHKHFTSVGPAPEFWFENSGTYYTMIYCRSSITSGEVSGVKTLKTTITYEGCSAYFKDELVGECKNEGEANGVMIANLIGKPVYLNESHTETGIQFEPEVKNAKLATCETSTIGVHEAGKGGLDGLVAGFTGTGSTHALRLECNGTGQQAYRGYWEGSSFTTAYMEGRELTAPWKEVCVSSALNNLKFEEGVKIAAGAPIVTTTPVTSTEGTVATLNGTVNPRGSATKYYFTYEGGGVGRKTSEFSAGEGTTSVPVSALVKELTPGVIYHYHIVASNAGGTSEGGEQTFLAEPAKFQPTKGAGAFPVSFGSTSGKIILNESESTLINKIECKQETGGTGKFTNAKEARLTLKFVECTTLVGGTKVSCGKAGVIETKELIGLIDYTDPVHITSEGRETGMVIKPVSGEVIAEANCSVVKIAIKGSMIGVFSSLNTRTKSLSLSLKHSGYTQTPNEYEAEGGAKTTTELKCSFNSGTAIPCGLEAAPTFALVEEEGLIEAY